MTEFRHGNEVFIIDVQMYNGEIKGSKNLFDNKQFLAEFGRIGHTKNEAIDNVIKTLLGMKSANTEL